MGGGADALFLGTMARGSRRGRGSEEKEGSVRFWLTVGVGSLTLSTQLLGS